MSQQDAPDVAPVTQNVSCQEQHVLPQYKDILDLIKKGSTLEAQEKIMELREAAVELQDENRTLKDHVKELEERLKIKEALVWDKSYYWCGEGEEREGPFCQRCYDSDEKLIRLQEREKGKWYCHECRNTFYDSNYSPPRRPRVRSKGIW